MEGEMDKKILVQYADLQQEVIKSCPICPLNKL